LPVVWKALGDPHRRAVLDLLRRRPMTTGDLAARFRVSRFAVMKHLRVLQAAGLVFVRPQGRERWNHLNPVPLRQAYHRWLKPFEESAADALLSLKHAAEHPIGGPPMSATTTAKLSAYDVRLEVSIAAPRKRVWTSLTKEISRWWPKHFYTHPEPKRFVVEPHVGGRVFEDWGNDAGGLWGIIIQWRPGELMQWACDHFPQCGNAGRCIITVELRDAADGTVVHVHDSGYGRMSDSYAGESESGWRELVGTHLKAYVEK
jgi:DNA-binding transcriptional ArsR family regulator/uncharacterized protein YndB with AHSA1/START domain